MQRKYGIYNYEIGEYQLFDTVDLAVIIVKQKMNDMANNVVNSMPISIIDIDDDGVETWMDFSGKTVVRENGKPFSPNDVVVEFMTEFENYMDQITTNQ